MPTCSLCCILAQYMYSKTCLKQPLKSRQKKVFKTDYRLMQAKSIAECSILQYFRPALSYHPSLVCLFFECLLKTIFNVLLWTIQILLYKYNILERVLVENIIPRNVIINRGAAEVDNNISRDDFSTSTLSRLLYLFYYTEHYSFIF